MPASDAAATLAAFDRQVAELRRLVALARALVTPRPPPPPPPPPDAE
jgi:hypothetical protein